MPRSSNDSADTEHAARRGWSGYLTVVGHNRPMPRPSKPLIDREKVIATALDIIDAEGLAACSLPRLAREIGVKAPSLYHHFADRAEIMSGVARAIVRETVIPRKREPSEWTEWMVAQAVSFRRAILRHPHAAPILLEFVPSDVLSRRYEDAAAMLTKAGIPADKHVLIFDGIEHLVLGAGLVHAMKDPAIRKKIFPYLDRDTEPSLAAAVDANPWTSTEKLFAETIRAFLRGAAEA